MTISNPLGIAHVHDIAELATVPSDSLDALQSIGTVRLLSQGQTLQMKGDPITHASVVLSGTLVVGLSDAAGRSHIVRPITAGQFLNLLPVFDGGPAIHDVYASDPATLMLFESSAFLQLMREHPALRDALYQILHYRNRLLYAELANIALLPLRQRCAQLLLQVMLPAHTTPGSGAVNEIRVSQTELAQMLGYTRPVVNRELRRLAEENVLNLNYSRIHVTDPKKLRCIAQGMPV